MGDDTTTLSAGDIYTVTMDTTDWTAAIPVLTRTGLSLPPARAIVSPPVPEKCNHICKSLTNGDIVVDVKNIKHGYVHINGRFHQMYDKNAESRGYIYPDRVFQKVGNIRELFNEFVLEKL